MADRSSSGRFTAGNRAASVRKAKSPPGTTGVRSYGGIIDTGENDRALTGSQKWVTYANAFNRPPVAIAAILRYSLHSGAKWTLHENKAGGKAARRGVEIVQEGLLDARFESGDTWQEVVAKAGMSWFNGSSLHAFALGRRKDGMVVVTDIAHRPMHTIDRWLRPSDTKPFESVAQRLPTGGSVTVPLDECLYIREGMLGDDPFGVGVLRLVAERIRRAGNYDKLEGLELFSSLGGLPVLRVPMEEIRDSVKHLPEDQQQAAINAAFEVAERVVRERIKTPEKQQYLVFDSATFKGVDPNTITIIQKWAVEIVKADLQGLADIRKVITDLDLDVAGVVGVRFAYVGGGDTKGTFSGHESMFGVFEATTQGGLDRIAIRARDQVARKLIAANGLDPDTATPTLVPEKIGRTAVLDAVAALEGMARAGLHPEDPARNIIREQVDLPPEPEDMIAELMLPRGKPDPAVEDVTEEDDPKVTDATEEDDPKVDETPAKKRRR